MQHHGCSNWKMRRLLRMTIVQLLLLLLVLLAIMMVMVMMVVMIVMVMVAEGSWRGQQWYEQQQHLLQKAVIAVVDQLTATHHPQQWQA
jgi:flagellar basal body-associated protein FliL